MNRSNALHTLAEHFDTEGLLNLDFELSMWGSRQAQSAWWMLCEMATGCWRRLEGIVWTGRWARWNPTSADIGVGQGVREIRIRDEAGAFRV